MPLRTVTATRYVTPLREGGSLPAIVEGGDDGLYVLKFRGAGQGPKALIAELVAGELARAVGLNVPEIVFMQLDAELARTEPDAEIQDLIRASAGLNLALDYLPGSVTFDPLLGPLLGDLDADLASAIVWHDAYTSNVDRSARNTNLLVWHRRLWLIDHGAALVFQHAGGDFGAKAASPFAAIASHVLLPWASRLRQADERLTAMLTPQVIADIVALIPDGWLSADAAEGSVAEQRAAYLAYFTARLSAPRNFVEEALRGAAQQL